jgi:hypothetical protein
MENQGFFSQMLKRGMSSEETHVTILVKKKDVNVDFVLGYVYGSLSKAADSLHVRMDARARTHLLQHGGVGRNLLTICVWHNVAITQMISHLQNDAMSDRMQIEGSTLIDSYTMDR